MSGYCWIVGECVGCGNLIHFNPNRVPSIRVNGEREPLCRSYFNKWNLFHRVSKGLPDYPLDPNAYKPEPEENL